MTNVEVHRLPERTGNFTIMSNEAMQSGVTGNALMLLMSAFNFPETWEFTVRGMCIKMRWGEKKIRSALRSLIEHGFASRHKQGRAGQGISEGGEFLPDYYKFYESPSLNPYFEDEPEKKEMRGNCDSFTAVPHGTPSRSRRKEAQVKTEVKTEATVVVSQSVRATDGLSAESEKSVISQEQFRELENLVKEYSGFDCIKAELRDFVTETIQYLKSGIASGFSDNTAVMQKLKEISTAERSLIPFMQKLREICSNSLKKLKHPGAKDKFLSKVAVNQLMEYVPEEPESDARPEQKPEKQQETAKSKPETAKPLSFREMLWHMQRYMKQPVIHERNYQSEEFDSEEKFREYYGRFDYEMWRTQEFVIPDFFMNNHETMENALKFLTGFNDITDRDFKQFVGNCISYLAKALQNGKVSYADKRFLNTNNLLKELNYINCDIYHNDSTLLGFFDSFREHFTKKAAQYQINSNKEGYFTRMLVSFLGGEYKAGNMVESAKLSHYLDWQNKRRE